MGTFIMQTRIAYKTVISKKYGAFTKEINMNKNSTTATTHVWEMSSVIFKWPDNTNQASLELLSLILGTFFNSKFQIYWKKKLMAYKVQIHVHGNNTC